MIKLIEVALNKTEWDTTELHEELNSLLNDGWQIIGHCNYVIETRMGELGEFVTAVTPWERYTLYKNEAKANVELEALTLRTIISAERGETSNNQRPMWRCMTDEGDKVNIFLNEDDKEKDSFHLFAAANWGEKLLSMSMYEVRDVYISVALKRSKDGKWWEIALVRPFVPANEPF